MPIKTGKNQSEEPSSISEEPFQEGAVESSETSLKCQPIYPLRESMTAGFLTAGFKVRDKLTDYEMLVIGFAQGTGILDGYKICYSNSIYEKVYCNVTKKADNELYETSSDKQYFYHFFKNALGSWKTGRSSYSDELFFVCRYWNRDTEEIRHYLRKFFEVESI